MITLITISDTSIHQDSHGRYSLNDLHKASGGEQRHQPRYWLALQQTTELIDEIVNSGITLFPPTETKRGCRGGTYVCKELVYSYAMWISAAFALKVIRAYDSIVTGRTHPVAPEQSTRHAIITYFENNIPVCKRPVLPGEVLMTFDSYREISERVGYVPIHYEELRTLTCPEFLLLADKAEKHCLMWKKKMAMLA